MIEGAGTRGDWGSGLKPRLFKAQKEGQCGWNVQRKWRGKEMRSEVKFKIFNNLAPALRRDP